MYDLIPQFNKTPQAKSVFTEAFESIKETVLNWVDEDLHIETLAENGETSADNESSTILYAVINKKGILLTGDAGVKALDKAYSYKPQISDNLKFIQVPHHGSRRNVSPSVLDNILGEKGQEENKTAFISAGKESSTHPRQSVVNAFIRRGCKVIATKGATKRHQNGTPERKGWVTVEPLKFQARFQE